MNTNLTKFGLGFCAVAALAGSASAQKPTNAERGLIGVNLYDSGLKVVALYGSPDEIQAVSVGGGGNAGGGSPGFGGPGFGGPGGAPAGRGGAPRSGGPGPGASSTNDVNGPFGFGDDFLRQGGPGGSLPKGGGGGRGGPPAGYPGGGQSGPSGPSGGPPRGGGSPYGGPSGAPAGGGAASGPLEATQYTRWIYNRAGSKYGFIVDNQNRVVQIEAIGMQNNRVKTRKGVGFGATFAQIVKTYGTPDGYEVGGDTILVKYLVNKKVAFRLTRLAVKKPHVVTGVVVAAGKV